jgi:hypothetical protein
VFEAGATAESAAGVDAVDPVVDVTGAAPLAAVTGTVVTVGSGGATALADVEADCELVDPVVSEPVLAPEVEDAGEDDDAAAGLLVEEEVCASTNTADAENICTC